MAKSVDSGMTKLIAEMQYLDDHVVRIGVLAGSVDSDSLGNEAGDVKAEDLKEGRHGEQLELTQIEVFAIHELGLGIHKRNVITYVMDKHRATFDKLAIRVTNLVLDGKLTGLDALAFMGEKMVELCQKRIFDRINPPLEDATIKSKTRRDGKRADIPLVFRGQYSRSFRWNVVPRSQSNGS